MKATLDELEQARADRWRESRRREHALASLSAHLSAATARFLELVWEEHEAGESDDLPRYLAWRCGITVREAREYVRVAEALQGLPATRAAFSRGELTFTKVRALTSVATASCEAELLELAGLLTASQLERALRAYRRVAAADAGETHALEFVDWFFEDDGSLYLRARLAAEDGSLLVKALEAARERVLERRREEKRSAAAGAGEGACEPPARLDTEPPRAASVEALVGLAEASLAASDVERNDRTRLVVHVDAAALAFDGRGRTELEDGPVIAPETVRRLGCDAELVSQVERDGLPLSAGRRRRTVPPRLRRLLEARDGHTCCFPGCDRRRRLQAHHRRHWAHGGETRLDNLVLLCWHHHRLVHEGGYTMEDDSNGGHRFRNRYGVLSASRPPRPPPGSARELVAEHDRSGLAIGPQTNRNGNGDRLDLGYVVTAIANVVG